MFRTMGERTQVNSAGRSKTSAQRRSMDVGIDVPLILVVVTLLIFGLLMVYSASYDYSFRVFGSENHVFTRQLLWAVMGIGVAAFLTWMDYHFWRKLAVPAMLVAVVALFAVLIINEVRNGAVRTILGGSIQPSELAKLVTIIYLSVWLFSKRDRFHETGFGLIPLAAILGLLGGLIFLQPDLSAVITIFFLGGMMFFLAGGEMRQIILVVVLALLVGWMVVQLNVTGSDRVNSFRDGLKDPAQASYHVRRSLEAFVNGKLIGVGIGKSETKLTGLPFPSTDSIFAVVAEETGLLGAGLLVGLYALLLWRGLTIAQRAPDMLGMLLAAGLTVWVCLEAFVNMAVMVNLLPFAGNALPFISSGGSNLLVTCASMGILMNISRVSVKTKNDEGRFFGAVIDLRRRDRRRRVPRARGPESADLNG